ncbi:MAG: preprotein translocase subunit SecY [Gemmatales bacterium]|nr:preprotein translocase subunit SecY [Gemmatales bacterium]MDW8386832.1 preprotein translocase subunit SecY [Gemmatales bacterium]
MNRFLSIFKIPELAQKIVITLIFLAVYRIGYHIPLPIVDQEKMLEWAQGIASGTFGQLFTYATMFSGSNLGQMTIFGLGIMPYISASIIFQLLASVYPPLEKLQKEGESGRKKINEYTRYATVLICIIQSYVYINATGANLLTEYSGFFSILTAVVTMTAGTIFLMWIGEQIDEYGIGNGISLIIMAGIVARIPEATKRLLFEQTAEGGAIQLKRSVFELGGGAGQDTSLEVLIVLVLLFIGVVVGVIAITKAQRRIPTQSARHMRGRRVYGGTRQYLPLRVNQAGVMPVIFASSLLMLPYFLFSTLGRLSEHQWAWADLLAMQFIRQGYLYNVFYIALIFFFCYFWTAITFNPKDMANNLKDYGSFIPGYRPGKTTAEYLERVMMRITYVGSAFLAVVAIIPTLVSSTLGVDPLVAQFYGGTGLLIVVSVALDLVQKINSHLVMRNYPGLTED